MVEAGEVHYSVFEMALAFFAVFGIFFFLVSTIADPEEQERLFFAKDAATITTTLQAVPGDVKIHYPNRFPNSEIVFDTNQVFSRPIGSLTDPVNFIFNLNSNYILNTGVDYVGALSFIKTGNTIDFGGTELNLDPASNNLDTSREPKDIYIKTSTSTLESIKTNLQNLLSEYNIVTNPNSANTQIIFERAPEDKLLIYHGGKTQEHNIKANKISSIINVKLRSNFDDFLIERSTDINSCFNLNSVCILIYVPRGLSESGKEILANALFNSLEVYYE